MQKETKQTKVRKNPISSKRYKQAFMQFYNCTEKDFEMKPDWEGGPMLSNFQNRIYRIDSENDIEEYCRELLSHQESATFIPIDLWVEIAEGVHMETNFFVNFFSRLEDTEYAKVNLALTASKVGTDPISAFWYSIYNIDDMDLFPKAVLAAAETYNFDTLVDELAQLYIENGEEHLNQMQKGVFETICLDANTDNEEYFYIYTVDPVKWDV